MALVGTASFLPPRIRSVLEVSWTTGLVNRIRRTDGRTDRQTDRQADRQKKD